MKNIALKILGLALAVTAVAACKKDETPSDADISGQWHLVSSDKIDIESEGIDVYIDFRAAGDFELYQKIGEGRYRLKYGRYAVTGTQVSGTYSGDIPWGSSYEAAVDGNTLILTAANASGEVCTYEKETIPAEVISGAVEFRSSGEGVSAGGWL